MARMLQLLAVGCCGASSLPSLAELAERHGTDKSMHGHAYVNLYAMLLDPYRESVRNVTEVGVMHGASALMWADYFANAQVWGLDLRLGTLAGNRTASQPRIHLHEVDASLPSVPGMLGLANESMDLVVEDASHSFEDSHRIAENLWHLVKPGGFYVIEDVNVGGDARGKYSKGNGQPGVRTMTAIEPPQPTLPPTRATTSADRRTCRALALSVQMAQVAHNATGALREIFLDNEVFFADTMIGIDVSKSAFAKDQHKRHWLQNNVDHNWHLVVIRKRVPGLTPRSDARRSPYRYNPT